MPRFSIRDLKQASIGKFGHFFRLTIGLSVLEKDDVVGSMLNDFLLEN